MSALNLPPKNTTWQFQEGELPAWSFLSALISEVLSFKAEWELDTSRQNGTPTHKDTRMFQILYLSYDWKPGEPIHIEIINSLKSDAGNASLNNILTYLGNVYNGKVVRCEVIEMMGVGSIPKHVDSSPMLAVARRVHVPLLTNPNVDFTVMDKTLNMKVGSWYEINNSLPHSVENKSSERRIHMICDVLTKDYFDAIH
jgi:Aspartyl/Asparaginyl beta-hydroxylase